MGQWGEGGRPTRWMDSLNPSNVTSKSPGGKVGQDTSRTPTVGSEGYLHSPWQYRHVSTNFG
jgi:hypothetical protein